MRIYLKNNLLFLKILCMHISLHFFTITFLHLVNRHVFFSMCVPNCKRTNYLSGIVPKRNKDQLASSPHIFSSLPHSNGLNVQFIKKLLYLLYCSLPDLSSLSIVGIGQRNSCTWTICGHRTTTGINPTISHSNKSHVHLFCCICIDMT